MVGKAQKKVTDNQVQKMMSGLVLNHNDIGASSSSEFQSEAMLQRLPQVVIVSSSSLIVGFHGVF